MHVNLESNCEENGSEAFSEGLKHMQQDVIEEKGFVCFSCFNVLNNYHAKTEILMLKLDDCIQQRCGQPSTTSSEQSSHDNSTPGTTHTLLAASAPKRRKLSYESTSKTFSPEVTVSQIISPN